MNNGSWEAVRQGERKRFPVKIVVFLPVVAAFIIVIVNNRDLFIAKEHFDTSEKLIVPDKVVPDRVVPDRVVPDKVVPDKVVPDKVVPDRKSAGTSLKVDSLSEQLVIKQQFSLIDSARKNVGTGTKKSTDSLPVRDTSSGHGKERQPGKHHKLPVFKEFSHQGRPPLQPLVADSMKSDFLKRNMIQKQVLSIKESGTLKPAEINKGTVASMKKETEFAGNDTEKLFSVHLPPIECSLRNRKDIVINLSLELFFRDDDIRASIDFHRENIKIMVKKNFLDVELERIKINLFEMQLLECINSIFGNPDIASLKITNIYVEKAFRQ